MPFEEFISYNPPLAPLCSLELGGPARYLVEALDEETVIGALHWARECGIAVIVLGGGSNVVIADRGFDGLVVLMVQRGIEMRREGGAVRITAQAGEPWDPFVQLTVSEGLAGIECLSGIPGLVGAVPVQNVGAYGQEVSETISSVRVLDRKTLKISEMAPKECRFAYRTSIFKNEQADRFVILAVSFTLLPGGPAAVRYAELKSAIGASNVEPTLAHAREAVIALRRRKSMVFDPTDENRRSVGSFFLNPVVSAEKATYIVENTLSDGVVSNSYDIPQFPVEGGKVKLAAGWLLEHAGVRMGKRRGPVGVSSRHVLALVHHGGGTTSELLEFARHVRNAVAERFDVMLKPEPVLIGFAKDDPL